MDKTKQIRTRFAPSPTGYMHIGGMRTALYAYMFAKKNGGTFVLRIEDTDLERRVEGAEDIIYNTLHDAGIMVDEGPMQGGAYGPYIQSMRKDMYLQYAIDLVKSGGAYYCFCSKDRLDTLHKTGHTKYDKHCLSISLEDAQRRVAAGESYVIRQNIPTSGASSFDDLVFGMVSVPNEDMEDNVLIKSDGMPTYNFANVVDDHLMAITHVIRGTEYLSSTPKYNLIYDGLGWARPIYMHLQPIMRDASHKLSKRHGDKSYDDYIGQGYLKDAIINYIALLGWSPKENREKFGLQEMIDRFDVAGLSKSSSIFDENKMKWLNSVYIQELSDSEFCSLASSWLDMCKLDDSIDRLYLCGLLKSRCAILSDVIVLTQFLQDSEWRDFGLDLFVNSKWKTDSELAGRMLGDLLLIVRDNFDRLYEGLAEYATSKGYKSGQVLWIFRIAITGATSTPGGATEMATLIGRDRCMSRLEQVIKRLAK